MRNRLLLSLVLLVFLLPGCGSPSPQSALENFGKQVSKPGVDMLSTEVLALCTKDCVSKMKTSNAGDGVLESAGEVFDQGFIVESSRESNGVATVIWKSNRADRSFHATLIKEGGFWRVQEWYTLQEAIDWIMDK